MPDTMYTSMGTKFKLTTMMRNKSLMQTIKMEHGSAIDQEP
jgi:hypothetical protein